MRPVLALLICLTALGSGCAARQDQPAARQDQPAAPQVVTTTRCARPAAPVLPRLRGDLPLDHPVNVEAMLTRDARQRHYVNGLKDALGCYDAQVGKGDASGY